MADYLESRRRELIGRDAELRVLEAWLQQPDGSRIVFVHGERGIGRTALWRRATELAAAEDFHVMTCRPARAEAGTRFAALGDILQGVPGQAWAALAAPQQAALRAVLFEVDHAGARGETDVRAVSVSMLALLRRLTADRPAVVAIDDLQWLDEGTTEVIQFAFRRLGANPVLIVATYSTGVFGLEREPQLPFEDVEERVVSVPLPPLSDGEVRRLLHLRSGEGWPRSLVLEASRLANGNPRLALELAPQPGRDLEDKLALPGTLMRWLVGRLSELSEPAMETLVTAACLRDPALDQLQRILGGVAASGLEDACSTGLMEVVAGRVRFRRPAVAAGLRQRQSAEVRRSLHRRAAAASEPVERLRHLALATAHPVGKLAAALEDASREMGRTGEHDLACQLADLSVQMTDPTDREAAARRNLLAGECHLALGDTQVAVEVFHALTEGLPAGRPERARLERRLAWLELWMHGVGESEQLLARAMSEVAGEGTLSALLHCDLSFARFLSGDPDGAAAHAARALELCTEPPVARRARSLIAAAGAAAGRAPWPEAAAPEDGASDPAASWDEWPQIALDARSRLFGDQPSMARPARGRGSEAEPGGVHWLAWSAETELWQEHWAEAEEQADRGLALATETGEWVAAIRLRYVSALVAANRGRLTEAREAARLGIDAAQGAGLAPLAALNRAVMGYVEHEAGAATAAVTAFEPLLGVDLPGPEPGLLRLFPNIVEALVEAGRSDRAADLLATLDACRRALTARWLEAGSARCHGLIAAASGRLDQAEGWLEHAIETERAAPRRLELGRHLLAAGMVRRRRRHREGAADALERARSTFAALGAGAWQERATAEIRRVSPRRTVPAVQLLTATQQQVADLVAQGHSNKEIAAALSLSIYTVESHLKAIFRRLGVRSRAALARRTADIRGERE